jgi:hypothetical protein
MNSASPAPEAASMRSMNRTSVTRFLRALCALALASRFGGNGRAWSPTSVLRARRRCAPPVTTLTSTLVPSLAVWSRAIQYSHNGCVGALPTPASRFVPVGQSRHPLSRRGSVLGPWVRCRARWGLTLRSTGPAGTCFDLRSASARRAGYLAR